MSHPSMPGIVNVSSKTVLLTLLAIISFLVCTHLAVHACGRWTFCGPLHAFSTQRGYIFDLSSEQNVPTWFAVMQLAMASALCLVVARVERQNGSHARSWLALAVLMAYLSLDEATDLHGLWRELTPDLNLRSEASGFDWVVPGLVIVFLVGLYFLRWLFSLPTRTRNYLFVAGAVYVMGGLGLEAVGALVGGDNFQGVVYGLVATAEETLEMVGILIFIFALLRHLENRSFTVLVT